MVVPSGPFLSPRTGAVAVSRSLYPPPSGFTSLALYFMSKLNDGVRLRLLSWNTIWNCSTILLKAWSGAVGVNDMLPAIRTTTADSPSIA